MAVAARHARVPAFQHVSRLAMVEAHLAFFPNNQSIRAAVVLAVTCSARSIAVLRHGRGMIAALLQHPLCNGRVALQTFAIAQLLSDFVACQTFGEAFELLMCSRERTGRNLREHNVTKNCAEKKAQRKEVLLMPGHKS